MRISDWSSDVCSSDRLDARIDRDSALVARAIGDERRRSTPLRIRHDSDHDHIVSGPVPPVRDRCAAADHSRALFDRTVRGGLSASDRPESEKSVRSEEHTSELQSLMRISYAVFCLKKKQQK